MKRCLTGLFLLLLSGVWLCLCGGCAPYMIVDGKKIEVLTDAEEKEMKEYARTIALNSPELKLSPSQLAFVRWNEPEVRLFYFSDRAGRVTYDWVFDANRTLRLSFGGHFLSDPSGGKMLFRAQVCDRSVSSMEDDVHLRLLNGEPSAENGEERK